MTTTYIFFSYMVIVSICIASYLFKMSLSEGTKNIFHSIDANSKTKENRLHIHAQFREFIDLHSATKQLSIKYFITYKKTLKSFERPDDFYPKVLFFRLFHFRTMTNLSNLYQPIFMILFPRNLFTVCSAMLLVQLELVEYSGRGGVDLITNFVNIRFDLIVF